MSYRQALEEIATGYIVGEKTNYKNTVDVMRSIAKEALETPQTKPLSDEEIIKIRQATKATTAENWADTLAFARAIEELMGLNDL